MSTTTVTDKRSAILEATLDLVAENGFHGTPMSQVAKRSGVSAGIIYHYFENKDDLMQALYADIKARWSAAVMAGEPHNEPYPDHLVHIWLNSFHFYANHPRETAFLEQFENSPYGHNWDEASFDENMQQLYALIQEDFRTGIVREMPLVVLYQMTIGVAIGLAKQQIAGAIELSDDDLEGIARACLRSIATVAEPA